ncbi:hypothetical protein [Streptomyces sp. NPDC048111]|uniref:hypothetical protein n=1 Tax=Streptomyces sp. NPDC048111 TaxID=3365500 RepID=UPI00371DA1D7
MPSAFLACLRRTLVVLVVLGALFGAVPGAQACEGRTVGAAEVSIVPEPSNESTPDAADAVLPVQPRRITRPDRPVVADTARHESVPTTRTLHDEARRPAGETGARCVVLRC